MRDQAGNAFPIRRAIRVDNDNEVGRVTLQSGTGEIQREALAATLRIEALNDLDSRPPHNIRGGVDAIVRNHEDTRVIVRRRGIIKRWLTDPTLRFLSGGLK